MTKWNNSPENSVFKPSLSPQKTITAEDLAPLFDVKVKVEVWAGSAQMRMYELLKLGTGAVITLDSRIGEPMLVTVNKRTIAKGELVVVEDKLGVSLNEIQKEAK